MAKVGRPKIKIDYELAGKLANIHCTQEEIASHLGVSVDTLQRDVKFCGIYKKGMDEGRMSLRRMQFKAASDGNITMQIWLGKQLLSQSDRQDVTHSGDINFITGRLLKAV